MTTKEAVKEIADAINESSRTLSALIYNEEPGIIEVRDASTKSFVDLFLVTVKYETTYTR